MKIKRFRKGAVYLVVQSMLFSMLAYAPRAGALVVAGKAASSGVGANFAAGDGFAGDKLSPDLRELTADADQNRTVKVILQSDDTDSPRLLGALKGNNARIEARARSFDMLTVAMRVRAVQAVPPCRACSTSRPTAALRIDARRGLS